MSTTDDTTALTIPTLTMLAGEINDAHAQVQEHAKGMLLEAKRAGDALLKAKQEVKHGEFQAWVEANCGPYERFRPYMKVAKIAAEKNVQLHAFDGGIRAFLDAHTERRKAKPKAEADAEALRTFTEADAEHAHKLHAMATRGATENERAVGRAKLENFASQFGKTADEVVQQAEEVKPSEPPSKSSFEQQFEETYNNVKKRFGNQSKDYLLKVITDLILKLGN